MIGTLVHWRVVMLVFVLVWLAVVGMAVVHAQAQAVPAGPVMCRVLVFATTPNGTEPRAVSRPAEFCTDQ